MAKETGEWIMYGLEWDDELAGIRSKKIMDCFADSGEFMGVHLFQTGGCLGIWYGIILLL